MAQGGYEALGAADDVFAIFFLSAARGARISEWLGMLEVSCSQEWESVLGPSTSLCEVPTSPKPTSRGVLDAARPLP